MNYYQLIFKPSFREDFYESQTYIFKSDLELQKGDYVVAMTKFGYSIAVVYQKNEVEVSKCYSEGVAKIVTKLDGNYYQEKEAAEKLKVIEKRLNQKAKEMSKFMQYEAVAKYDIEAQELLKEYEQIKNNNIALLQIESTANRDKEVYEDDLPF